MTGEVAAGVDVALSELGGSLCVMRLCVAEAQKQMQLSLSRLGQLTPVQAWRSNATGSLEIFDGVKRWRAAQALSWPSLRVDVHELDAAGAKVRLVQCNTASGVSDLEVAWVVRSLYREDRLDQPQIARLLGRDKSWVSRKLTLADELSDEVTANVRLGLLSATTAVQLARLQRCNQDMVAKVVIRRGLTTRQTARLVTSLLEAPNEKWAALLEQTSKPASAPVDKGGATRRTPGEQMVADAWAMKRIGVRLHARLMERSLPSLGELGCAVVSKELAELKDALGALSKTLESRLSSLGGTDAAAG